MLRESALNPNDKGPLQLVIDEHLDDPVYLERKAKELIDEAIYSMKLITPDYRVYKEKMQKAVFFAVVARCIREITIINQDR